MSKPAGGQANINADELKSIKIDYFPLEQQLKYCEALEKDVKLLQELKDLILAIEAKIQTFLLGIFEK